MPGRAGFDVAVHCCCLAGFVVDDWGDDWDGRSRLGRSERDYTRGYGTDRRALLDGRIGYVDR